MHNATFITTAISTVKVSKGKAGFFIRNEHGLSINLIAIHKISQYYRPLPVMMACCVW